MELQELYMKDIYINNQFQSKKGDKNKKTTINYINWGNNWNNIWAILENKYSRNYNIISIYALSNSKKQIKSILFLSKKKKINSNIFNINNNFKSVYNFSKQ